MGSGAHYEAIQTKKPCMSSPIGAQWPLGGYRVCQRLPASGDDRTIITADKVRWGGARVFDAVERVHAEQNLQRLYDQAREEKTRLYSRAQ